MTDEHDHDDQHHDQVRRLLADARHDEPVPADVADRLDRVLAQLAAGGPLPGDEPATERAPVVDLAAQRRRSRARNLLVAAAAVVAVGVGIGQLDLGMSGSSDGQSAVSADEDAPEAASGGDSELESGAEKPASGRAESFSSGTGRERAAAQLMLSDLVVTDTDFSVLAERKALSFGELASAPTSGSSWLDPEEQGSAPTAPDDGADLPDDTDRGASTNDLYDATVCGAGPYGNGSLFLVTYRRHPAVLAVRPREGDSTVVDLLRCGTGEVLRSSTVPTP